MIVELDKSDIIRLISGTKPKMETCIELTKYNLMSFCGDGWNADWEWNKEQLQLLTESKLYGLYMSVKPNSH